MKAAIGRVHIGKQDGPQATIAAALTAPRPTRAANAGGPCPEDVRRKLASNPIAAPFINPSRAVVGNTGTSPGATVSQSPQAIHSRLVHTQPLQDPDAQGWRQHLEPELAQRFLDGALRNPQWASDYTTLDDDGNLRPRVRNLDANGCASAQDFVKLCPFVSLGTEAQRAEHLHRFNTASLLFRGVGAGSLHRIVERGGLFARESGSRTPLTPVYLSTVAAETEIYGNGYMLVVKKPSTGFFGLGSPVDSQEVMYWSIRAEDVLYAVATSAHGTVKQGTIIPVEQFASVPL